nr:unnamed protein product [Callosobruchus analis]
MQEQPENIDSVTNSGQYNKEEQASSAARSSHNYLLENYIPKKHPTYKCLLDNPSIEMATKEEVGALKRRTKERKTKQTRNQLSKEPHGTDQNTTKTTEPNESTASTKNEVEEYDQKIEHEVENQHRRNLDRRNMYSFYERLSKSAELQKAEHQNPVAKDHEKEISVASTDLGNVESEKKASLNDASSIQRAPTDLSMNIRHPQIPREPPPPPKNDEDIDGTSVQQAGKTGVIEGVFLCKNMLERNVIAIENIKRSKTETSDTQEKYLVKTYSAPEEAGHRREMKSSYTVDDDKMFRCSNTIEKNLEIIKKNEELRRRIFGKRQVFEKEQPQIKQSIPEVGTKAQEKVKNEPPKVFEKEFDTTEDKPRINIGDLKKEIKNTIVNNRIDIEVGEKVDKRKESHNGNQKLPEIDYDKSGRTIKRKPPTVRSKTGTTIEKALLSTDQKHIENAHNAVDKEMSLSRSNTEDNREIIKKNEELRRRIFGKRKVFKEEQVQLEKQFEMGNNNKNTPEYGQPRCLEIDIAQKLPETSNDKSRTIGDKRDPTKKEMQSPTTTKTQTLSRKDQSPSKAQIVTNTDEESITKNMKSSYTVEDDAIFLSSSYQGDSIETIKKNQELRRRIFGRRKVFKEEQEELDDEPEFGNKNKSYEKTKDPPKQEPLAAEPEVVDDDKILLSSTHEKKNIETIKDNEELRRRIFGKRKVFKQGQDQIEESQSGSKPSEEIKDESTKVFEEDLDERRMIIENLRDELEDINENRKNEEVITKFEKLRQKVISGQAAKLPEADASKKVPEMEYDKSGGIKKVDDAKKEALSAIKVSKPMARKDKTEMLADLEDTIVVKKMNILDRADDTGKNIEGIKKDKMFKTTVISKGGGLKEKHDKVEKENNKDIPTEVFKKVLDISKGTRKINIENLRQEIEERNLNRQTIVAVDKFEKLRQKVIGSHDHSKLLRVDGSKNVHNIDYAKAGFEDKITKQETAKYKLLTDKTEPSELAESWSSRDVKVINAENLKQEIVEKQYKREINSKHKEITDIYIYKRTSKPSNEAKWLFGDRNKNDPPKSEKEMMHCSKIAEKDAKPRSFSAPVKKRTEYKSPDMRIKEHHKHNVDKNKNEVSSPSIKHERNHSANINKTDQLKYQTKEKTSSKTVRKEAKPRSHSVPIHKPSGGLTNEKQIKYIFEPKGSKKLDAKDNKKNELSRSSMDIPGIREIRNHIGDRFEADLPKPRKEKVTSMDLGVIRETRNNIGYIDKTGLSRPQKGTVASSRTAMKEGKPRSRSAPVDNATEVKNIDITSTKQYKCMLDNLPEKGNMKADKADTKDKKRQELSRSRMQIQVLKEARNNVGVIDKTVPSKLQEKKITSSSSVRKEIKPRSYSAPVQKHAEDRNADMTTKKQYKYMLDISLREEARRQIN